MARRRETGLRLAEAQGRAFYRRLFLAWLPDVQAALEK
jgi:hypothetical protein